LRQDHRLLGTSGWRENEARLIQYVGCAGRQLDRLSRVGNSFVKALLRPAQIADDKVSVGVVWIELKRTVGVCSRRGECRFAIIRLAKAGVHEVNETEHGVKHC
jgi:hypothetical protein